MATCRVFLLGGFRVDVDGRAVTEWGSRRGADLVKLLALARGHRLHREAVIDALWPELDPDAGAANLRKALHFARRALGSEDAVRADGPMLALPPDAEVDVDRFEAEAARAGDTQAAERAARRYGGELLPEDAFETWVAPHRDRLRRRYLDVLKAAGRWEEVVGLDPLDEGAHRELMREALEAGDRAAAMRRFERLRDVLREELGVGPDATTVALYREVLALEGPDAPGPAAVAREQLAAGLVALNRMDLDAAERHARAARRVAVDAELGAELGEASGLLGMVAHARGRWRELFREEFDAVLAEAPHLAPHVFDAHLCLGEFSLAGLEPPASIEGFARELLATARERGSRPAEALATLMLGEAELLGGALDDSVRDLAAAAQLHRETGADAARALSMGRLAEAHVERGRRAKARAALDEAMEVARPTEMASHLEVRVWGTRVLAAEPERAAAEADRASAGLADAEPCQPCSMQFLVVSTTAWARAGVLDRATEQLERARRVAAMWTGGPWEAAVWEATAEVRRAEGQRAQAAALFREAAEGFGRCGHVVALRRCAIAAEGLEQMPVGNGSGTSPS